MKLEKTKLQSKELLSAFRKGEVKLPSAFALPHDGEEHRLSQAAQTQAPARPHPITLGKLLTIYRPQFPHLYNRKNSHFLKDVRIKRNITCNQRGTTLGVWCVLKHGSNRFVNIAEL